MVCKAHDITEAPANRFKNDLVCQPQADCFSVSFSLIIPHKDRGSLLVSLTQTEPADHRYESDKFSLALVDTVAELSLMAKKKSMASYCSLSSAPVSMTVTWVLLPNPVQPPWDSR